MKAVDAFLLVFVGAFWGCTNPFLRRGAAEVAQQNPDDGEEEPKTPSASTISTTASTQNNNKESIVQVLQASALKFLNVRVWLPYALNQFGSVLFYIVLSRSDLTLAVPICNALALVFSIFTTFALGETVDRPGRAMIGSALVMAGVGICLHSREDDSSENTTTG